MCCLVPRQRQQIPAQHAHVRERFRLALAFFFPELWVFESPDVEPHPLDFLSESTSLQGMV